MPTPEQIAADIASGAYSSTLQLSGFEAFTLIANLQLALRHPGNTGAPAVVARQTIATLTRVFARSPGILALIAAGDDPAQDDAAAGAPR